MDNEDTYNHLTTLYELCGTMGSSTWVEITMRLTPLVLILQDGVRITFKSTSSNTKIKSIIYR